MAIESRNTLKTYFETGDVPTEAEFGNLIDSSINLSDDGVYTYQDPVSLEKRLGVGITQPTSTLGVKAQGTNEELVSLHNLGDDQAAWIINMLPEGAVDKGFNIQQETAIGSQSRLFINSNTGNIGLGTLSPVDLLHLEKSEAGDLTGLKLLNLASVGNQGWRIGHLQDALAERDGALSFVESGPDIERMVLIPNGNLGLNESDPDTLFHVSKSTSDPDTVISLVEGTGIASVGPITDNLVFDFESIQSRSGQYVGQVLNLDTATLNLQPLGGDLKIHAGTGVPVTDQMIITDSAFVGIGTDTPLERIDVNGAVKIGTTTNDNEGTIRWTGTDFEGRTDTSWLSLTAGGGKWTDGTGDIIYYTADVPRVGIGIASPLATLHVNDFEVVGEGNTAVAINNSARTTSTGQDDNRIALDISNISPWNGDPLSKDVGLYVSRISGQERAEVNLAAVLSGNVVVGDLVPGSDVIGTAGSRVLAIQTGVPPTNQPNTSTVQMYAADLNGTTTLHILRGNTETIKLYQESALTNADSTAFPVSYDATTIAILNNMRTRIDELESKLQAIGMLA